MYYIHYLHRIQDDLEALGLALVQPIRQGIVLNQPSLKVHLAIDDDPQHHQAAEGNSTHRHLGIATRHKHAQTKHSHDSAHINAGNRPHGLNNGVKVLHDEAAHYAVRSHGHNHQFHSCISFGFGVIDSRLDVVEVNHSGKGIQTGRKGTQRGTENAGDEDAGHAHHVTHYILDEERHQLVWLADQLKESKY